MRGLLLVVCIVACTPSSRVTEPDHPMLASDSTPTNAVDAGTSTQPPGDVAGYVSVPHQPRVQLDGKVTAAEAKPADGQTHWSITVESKAKAGQFEVVLPSKIALPFKQGDMINAEIRSYGGGPNVIMQLLVADGSGVPLIAINSAPRGWTAGRGRKVSFEKGDPYDETAYQVKLGPSGKQFEIGKTWSAGTVDGVHYLGQGSSVKRTMHKGQFPPPDYVEAWTDYSVIRVP